MTDRKDHAPLSITRRDFIGGVAVAISGGLGWRWSEARTPTQNYPPILTGMRGSHDGSFEVAHQMRDGRRWANPRETAERYDLVVVGAGLSGLSAAWYYREQHPDARILILDNHDDFGGHAKRNEFWLDDRLLLSHGGTEDISDVRRYSRAGRDLLHALGIDVTRYTEFHDASVYADRNMSRGTFLDKETFGKDALLTGPGQPTWRKYFERSPLSSDAQAELVRVFESDQDYLSDLSRDQKLRYVRSTSYETFLRTKVGLNDDAIAYLWESATWAMGLDGISVWVAIAQGWPGTAELKLDDALNYDLTMDAIGPNQSPFCHFPDGNATITRLLVRQLVPAVAPGNTVDDVITAPFDYAALDTPKQRVRVRLNSTAVNVQHRGKPTSSDDVRVTYVQGDTANTVNTSHCIMACYNAAIPHICPELPEMQKQALSVAAKAPLIYTNVLLSNWRAFEKLGIQGARCPSSYFQSTRLTVPLNIGDYQHATSPDEPIILRMRRAPLNPALRGRSPKEQWRAGRMELLASTFETFETKIRDQLDRMLSAGGFEHERDIKAITVNRWPHGYAYGHDPETGQFSWMLDELTPEQSPWITARQRFGRIAIANSDATADAMTEGAFNAAKFAVDALSAE
ncbi:MAG: NAD(P)-binding protein [Pseudomonadota bacterium]